MSKTYSERVRDFSTQNVGGSLYTSMHYAEDMAEDADSELSAAREERDALRAQVAKLRKNSDRYLWLRDHSEHAPPNERGESVWPVIGTSCVSNLPCVGNDLDAACDAAIAERARDTDHSA